MKHFLRWVSPLILGVIEFYFLRLATDPSRGTEWWPDFNNQLRALLLTILLCYIVDYCLRNIFHKYIFRKEIVFVHNTRTVHNDQRYPINHLRVRTHRIRTTYK